MKHRPVHCYQGEHQAPVVVHPVRLEPWSNLLPGRPSLRRVRAVIRALHGWHLTDGIRLM